MSNKNIIYFNKDIPDKIRREVRWWDMYAKLSPILYIGVGLIFYYFEFFSWQVIAGIGAGAFALTAVTWWFWTVNTIGEIVSRTEKSEHTVQEVLLEIREIKDIVRQIRNT